jgi:hypothetical protein
MKIHSNNYNVSNLEDKQLSVNEVVDFKQSISKAKQLESEIKSMRPLNRK